MSFIKCVNIEIITYIIGKLEFIRSCTGSNDAESVLKRYPELYLLFLFKMILKKVVTGLVVLHLKRYYMCRLSFSEYLILGLFCIKVNTEIVGKDFP